jgi:hypothetical protein
MSYSQAPAPYCKTFAEACAPGAVFPNGYRRVGDERTPYQLVLDLQNECFRRMDAMTAAHAEAIGKLTADLTAERAARQKEVAALTAEHAKAMTGLTIRMEAMSSAYAEKLTIELGAERAARQKEVAALTAEHAKSIAQMRAEQQDDRRVHQQTLSELRAELTSAKRHLTAELTASEQRQSGALAQERGRLIDAIVEMTERVSTQSTAGMMAPAVDKLAPVVRNRIATKLGGPCVALSFRYSNDKPTVDTESDDRQHTVPMTALR